MKKRRLATHVGIVRHRSGFRSDHIEEVETALVETPKMYVVLGGNERFFKERGRGRFWMKDNESPATGYADSYRTPPTLLLDTVEPVGVEWNIEHYETALRFEEDVLARHEENVEKMRERIAKELRDAEAGLAKREGGIEDLRSFIRKLKALR